MIDNNSSSEERGDKYILAISYMAVAVFLYSLAPVLFYKGEADDAPFIFNAVRVTAECLAVFIYLIVIYYYKFSDVKLRDIWCVIRTSWRKWLLLGVLIGTFDVTVLGWSLKYIDISAATILYQTWPIWMILFIGRMFAKKGRYENISAFGWVCIIVGFIGLGIVILSQASDALLEKEADSSAYLPIFLGSFLALVAAIMGALHGACSIRWGEIAMNNFLENASSQSGKSTKRYAEMFFVMIGIIIASIPGIIIGAVWGVWGSHNEIIKVNNMAIAAAHGAFFAGGMAMIFSRMANLATTKLEINALSYAGPVLSLLWLGILGYIDVVKIDWLVIGAISIVAANALLNFKAERRMAYQSLVVALWVCGAIVYFRTFFHAPVFYETVAVVTTMFILILSFRIDRLVRRTSAEDEMTLEIWQKISSLPEHMQDKLCEIDEAHTTKKLGDAYKNFRDSLKKEYADNKEKFSDIMQRVNILAHSKQQGDNFGEHAVLWILGGVSAGGLLFFMPEGVNAESGAGGFFLEMAAFLVAATVIFLLFNIQDLHQDRKHQVLRTKSDTENPNEKNKLEGLVFREDQDRTAARRISVFFCAGIVITFGFLFWFKWMPT